MTNIWDEKPEAHIYCLLSYKKEEMDEWLEKLMMEYEDRLLKMRNKVEELLNDIGVAQGFKVRPLESKAKEEEI